MSLVVDLFAGVGFGVACRRLGLDELGFDNARAVLATRKAAGMGSVSEDVANLRPSSFVTEDDTLIAGPPCQPFSMASPKGKGRRALDDILQHIHFDSYTSQSANRELADTIGDPRAGLVVEPLRWVEETRPRLVIFEQVTTVLPIWEYSLRALERMGYQGWVGILNAEQFGTLYPCVIHSLTKPAPNAEPSSLLATEVGRAGLGAMTPFDSEGTPLARSVVAHWEWAIARGDASVATLLERVRREATPARRVATTPTGRVDELWTIVGTSEYGLRPATVASIVSSWNNSLVDLSLEEKWFTMSTSRQTTTIRATLSSMRATPTTCTVIGQETIHEDCGLCLDHAVPQTWRRAFLVARRDGMPGKPTPTHSRFHTRSPERLDDGVLPWVSMRDALGREEAMLSQYSTNGDPSNRGLRSPDQPSPTVTSKAGRNFWVPWGLTHRPAVTVGNAVGRGLIGGQGAKDGILKAMERGEWVDSPHGDGSTYAERTRITHAEAGVLQTFPADFPWQGTTTEKFLTIGNAVPPLLAEVVIQSALEGQQ